MTSEQTPRYAVTAIDRQKIQLERLLKDPQKPVVIPAPPKEKTIRPAREMMKNVQGSSAGAGSGEFHVYKAGRRREYERLKLMEDEATKEVVDAEFEKKRLDAEAISAAKTAKNRAKRQKKKERAKTKSSGEGKKNATSGTTQQGAPVKKRRLVSGKELVFKRPADDQSDDEEEDGDDEPGPQLPAPDEPAEPATAPAVVEEQRITIHEED